MCSLLIRLRRIVYCMNEMVHWKIFAITDQTMKTVTVFHHKSKAINGRNNSWPLAIFQPISAFAQPKSVLVGQTSHTFSMGQQSVTYKISCLQKTANWFLILISSIGHVNLFRIKPTLRYCILYPMVGNFHGVQIFVDFCGSSYPGEIAEF